MHDLRLVGVHDDGEHLLLVDDQGDRYLLGIDDALRAAVRRDRTRLGQLQIEVEGGLRPRDVQARIRAGATREEVAAVAGWSVEKVERYEGPVLAERAHVAELARRVRLRRRGGESVLLGNEVATRLTDRGVDERSVTWDSWRTEEGPWTAVVYFVAGGRERQARWHLDLASSSVTPADDEARWLSEEAAPAEGSVPGLRLSAVPSPGVYDIEADGGVSSPGSRSGGQASGRSDAASLDLVTAMRTRRRESGRGVPARPATARPVVPASDDPAAVPGAAHPARRRVAQPEPLELDPTLMDDPPAAHPPASALPLDLADPADAELLGDAALFDEAVLDEPVLDEPVLDEPVLDEPVLDRPVGASVDEAHVEPEIESCVEAAVGREPQTEEALAEPAAEVAKDVNVEVPADAEAEAQGSAELTDEPVADEPVADEPAAHEPAAREPVVAAPVAAEAAADADDHDSPEPAAAVPAAPAPAPAPAPPPAAQTGQQPRRTGRPRGSNGRSGRNRRSSVPSWDDIMFGAKRD